MSFGTHHLKISPQIYNCAGYMHIVSTVQSLTPLVNNIELFFNILFVQPKQCLHNNV